MTYLKVRFLLDSENHLIEIRESHQLIYNIRQ